MLLKILFFINFIFAVNVYSISLPQISNNSEMIKVIKEELQRSIDNNSFINTICELQFYGVSSFSFIEDIENIFVKAFIKGTERGDSESCFRIVSMIKELGFEISDVIQSDDLQEALEIGIYKAFENGNTKEINDFIDFANKQNLSLKISSEKLKDYYHRGISKIFLIQDEVDVDDIQDYLRLLKEYNITVSSKNLTSDICDGIVKYIKKEGLPYYSISMLNENIEDINSELGINIQLKNIANIEEILTNEIEKTNDILFICLMLEDAEYNGFDLDISILKNDEIIKSLLHDRVSYCLECSLEEFLEDEYYQLLEFSNKYKFDFNIFSMSDAFVKAIKFHIKSFNINRFQLLMAWAEKSNVVIEVSKIPNIKSSFEKGIFLEFDYYSTNEMIALAKNYNIKIDLLEILKSKIVQEISKGNIYEVRSIIKKAENLGMNIQVADLPKVENAFFECLLFQFKYYDTYSITNNSAAILNILTFAKENEISLKDCIDKALFETITKEIARESDSCSYNNINKILLFVRDILKVDLELSEIPNIKDAFYKGFEKTKAENNNFVHEYLKQLAIENKINLL